MKPSFFDEISHYREKNQRNPETRFWGSREGQNARFAAIMRHVSFKGARFVDLGCGSGDLLAYAVERGEVPASYLGIDIVPEFIEEARQRGLPGEFLVTDVTVPNWKPPAVDFVVANGLFGHKQPNDSWWSRYRILTERMLGWAEKGICYTLISRHSTGNNLEAQYCEPMEILSDLFERFGHWVVLDHSYLRNDFVVAIFKTPR